MAGQLKLSMMIGDYEIVRALKHSTVKPKGIELLVAAYPGTRKIHDSVASGEACDINEFNGGAYVVQKYGGRDDFTALPVFPHRRFRHGFIYINRSKGIEKPTDLVDRRVACRTLGAAANYWMRGHLGGLRGAAPGPHVGDRKRRRRIPAGAGGPENRASAARQGRRG